MEHFSEKFTELVPGMNMTMKEENLDESHIILLEGTAAVNDQFISEDSQSLDISGPMEENFISEELQYNQSGAKLVMPVMNMTVKEENIEESHFILLEGTAAVNDQFISEDSQFSDISGSTKENFSSEELQYNQNGAKSVSMTGNTVLKGEDVAESDSVMSDVNTIIKEEYIIEELQCAELGDESQLRLKEGKCEHESSAVGSTGIFTVNQIAKMGKPCKNIRAMWTSEDLQHAIAAIKKGTSVAEAARQFNIPRRTLQEWIKRADKNNPVRKLGRNPVFTTEIENKLKIRIVRLQQLGFGVTKKIICEKAVEICEALKIKNPFSKGVAGRYWCEGFLKRNPDIVLRKGENLSYGRLMPFTRQTVDHFFSLLQSVYEKTELQPHQIYNVGESGLQLCFSSNCKVLAQRRRKRVHVAADGEHMETVTIIACTNATGSSWIPPVVLHKDKCRIKEFGDDLPPGSVFCMTPKGYVTTEMFCQYLHHFNHYRIPGSCLLILDGQKCHMDDAILNICEELGIQILYLPGPSSHELQPIDKSFFKPLKEYWTQSLDTFCHQHPGQSINKLQFPKLFAEAWYQASTPANAVSGFQTTGIYPLNSNIFLESAFSPSSMLERK